MVHLSDYRYDSRIQRQARALAERGDHVELVCNGEADRIELGDGVIEVHPIGLHKPQGGARAYIGTYAEFLMKSAARITRLELRRHFDVVEAHNMPDALTAAAIVPRLRGAGVILNMHDTFPELFETKFERPPGDRLVRMTLIEERLSAKLADRTITITDQAKRLLESRGIGRGQITVVMNSPDEQVFGPPRPPVAMPDRGPIQLLYHGGTAPRFGVQTLIEAVGLLKDAPRPIELRVIGAGEDRERLRELARRAAPDRIEIADEVPFARIPDELASAHVGVVPTIRDSFTALLLPVKLMEDIHVGLPVIVSDLPGITSYFSENEVRLTPPGDPLALSQAILEVCADPQSAMQRTERAQARLETISWARQRARYLELVDELARVNTRTRSRLEA